MVLTVFQLPWQNFILPNKEYSTPYPLGSQPWLHFGITWGMLEDIYIWILAPEILILSGVMAWASGNFRVQIIRMCGQRWESGLRALSMFWFKHCLGLKDDCTHSHPTSLPVHVVAITLKARHLVLDFIVYFEYQDWMGFHLIVCPIQVYLLNPFSHFVLVNVYTDCVCECGVCVLCVKYGAVHTKRLQCGEFCSGIF